MGNGGELGSSFGCPVEQPPREALAMFFRCCCNPNDRTLDVLLGLDYRGLTYRFGGRDYRLADVDGHPIRGILA